MLLHESYRIDVNGFAAGMGVLITIYFWWQNLKGVHESSGKAVRIMQITTVMVAILVVWCPITILMNGRWHLPPTPLPSNLRFAPGAQGWLAGTFWLQIPAVAIIIAFGHSLLSMSGFETLAQVYREIAYPKLKNLKLTANLTCWYAVVCTGIVTLLAAMIIPDDIRPKYFDNLIGEKRIEARSRIHLAPQVSASGDEYSSDQRRLLNHARAAADHLFDLRHRTWDQRSQLRGCIESCASASAGDQLAAACRLVPLRHAILLADQRSPESSGAPPGGSV